MFLALVEELRESCHMRDSKYIGLEEQVAIFFYMCVTGLSVQHVGERFQHSNETISKYFYFYFTSEALSSADFEPSHRYFRKVLLAVSSPQFYPM